MTGTRGPLFDPVFGSSHADFSDEAWVGALVEVEAALARAASRFGLVSAPTAQALTTLAADPSRIEGADPVTLGAASISGGNPVIPLVTALRSAVVGLDDRAVPGEVHVGATSQDVIDSAAALLVHRAAGHLRAHADRVVVACADLARTHRDTPLAGRTLGQQALPTTFGLVAAGWGRSVRVAATAAVRAAAAVSVQFGGAAGTLAAVHPHGPALADAVADELALPRALAPWHTDRAGLTLYAGALGATAGSVAKVAGDVILHAATEIGELSVRDAGGSSAMPHKRNPTSAIEARAAAMRVPGLVATVQAAAAHEHQRAAGAWHAEWEPLSDLQRLTVGALARLAHTLENLDVHPDAMARNLDVTGGALLAERVVVAMRRDRPDARGLVTDACRRGRLDSDERLIDALGAGRLRDLLDPAGYLGHAADLVDALLPTLTPIDGTTQEETR
ncbi:MAG: lyase family protein [Dietzia sp.]